MSAIYKVRYYDMLPFFSIEISLKLFNAFLYFIIILSITVNLYVSISVHGYSMVSPKFSLCGVVE